MKRLSLHHLTALDATPAELATIAGRLECQHITLFTHVPEQARAMFPCVMPDDVPALSDALASANVSVCNLEVFPLDQDGGLGRRSEEHTSELQSLMRISYAVFCLKKKKNTHKHTQ